MILQAICIGWELGTYGADSEVGRYLGNHEGACDYEGMQSHADVEAFEVFAKDNILRGEKGKSREPLNNFGTKCTE